MGKSSLVGYNKGPLKQMLEPKWAVGMLLKKVRLVSLVRYVSGVPLVYYRGDERGPKTGVPSYRGAREPRSVATP